MGNISQQKREQFLEKLQIIRSNFEDDDEMRNILNAIEIELTSKKYGLVWEEHEERVDIEMKTKIPVFIEDKDREIILNSGKCNFLLEGDNLHSLKLLERTHKRRIDVIYIDPPYNTGNKDFIYNDEIVDKENKYRHSKWLSFMNNRLKLAKRLLKKDGIIFISIDDNEFAQLKLLCDEIFGEKSFVTVIHVEMSTTQGMKVKSAKNGNIVKNAEYILVYSQDGHKNIAKNVLYDFRPEYDSHYSKYLGDNDEVFNLKDVFLAAHPNEKIKNIVEAYSGNSCFKRFVSKNVDKIFRYDKVTGFMADDFENNVVTRIEKNNRKYVLQRKGRTVEQLMFLSDSFGECNDFKNSHGLRKIRGDWWSGFYLDMGNVSKEGNVVFKNGKKPKRLIKQLLEMTTNKDSIVLDFFAGSGTTGHAVLELNQEDGGERQFILCTNNEVNDEKEMTFFGMSKRQLTQFKETEEYSIAITSENYQSLGICRSATYVRIKNVLDSLMDTTELSSLAFPINLKYYKTGFIDKVNEDKLVNDNLINYIKEMIQLEHHVDIDNKNYVLLINDEVAEEYLENVNDDCKAIYKEASIFFDSATTLKLKKMNIEVIDIPEYYFGKELRDLGEL